MENSSKKTYTTGLVLGILSIPCGLLIAISGWILGIISIILNITGWILGIIGIVLNIKNKNEYKTTAGLVLSIIGLVLSVFNSILGAIIMLKSNGTI